MKKRYISGDYCYREVRSDTSNLCRSLQLLRFLHERRIAYLDLKGRGFHQSIELGIYTNPSPSPDSPGENCLIDQHGYLKIIDFGVAERITSGRIYAVPDLGFLECFGKFTCFSMEECPKKLRMQMILFQLFVAHGHAQTKIFKCHRVLIGASSTVVRKFVKDQAVYIILKDQVKGTPLFMAPEAHRHCAT